MLSSSCHAIHGKAAVIPTELFTRDDSLRTVFGIIGKSSTPPHIIIVSFPLCDFLDYFFSFADNVFRWLQLNFCKMMVKKMAL